MPYFNTNHQIQGDNAYYDEAYNTALSYYNAGLAQLRKEHKNQHVLTAEQAYELAYLLMRIVTTKVMILGQNPDSLQHLQTVEAEIKILIDEAKSLATVHLLGENKQEIATHIDQALNALYSNASIFCWNSVIILEENKPSNHIKAYKSANKAVEFLDKATSYCISLEALDKSDRSADKTRIAEKAIQILDEISVTCFDAGSDTTLDTAMRTAALNHAAQYNQRAYSIHIELRPEVFPIEVHLRYLQIQDALFNLTQQQKYLQVMKNYLAQHPLDNDALTEEQRFKARAYQFMIARNIQPHDVYAALAAAISMLELGPIRNNEVLKKEYDLAMVFLKNDPNSNPSPVATSLSTHGVFPNHATAGDDGDDWNCDKMYLSS